MSTCLFFFCLCVSVCLCVSACLVSPEILWQDNGPCFFFWNMDTYVIEFIFLCVTLCLWRVKPIAKNKKLCLCVSCALGYCHQGRCIDYLLLNNRIYMRISMKHACVMYVWNIDVYIWTVQHIVKYMRISIQHACEMYVWNDDIDMWSVLYIDVCMWISIQHACEMYAWNYDIHVRNIQYRYMCIWIKHACEMYVWNFDIRIWTVPHIRIYMRISIKHAYEMYVWNLNI